MKIGFGEVKLVSFRLNLKVNGGLGFSFLFMSIK